ncbi:MAG: MBL fold metallo-hydrolase [Ruminococcaceae bacterium]|nr:MBL fold metallo-hydrolase [Oscillospiraceae bacterium]
MIKKTVICLMAVLLLVGCAQQLTQEEITPTPMLTEPLAPLDMRILGIGDADAIVITTGGKAVVIDAGEKKDGKLVVEYLQSQGISQIEYMVITHFDKDHVGGADEIVDAMTVKTAIQPSYDKNSTQYNQYINALEEKGQAPIMLTEDYEFFVNDAHFTVYVPQRSDYGQDNDNDFSLVISMRYGNKSFLFAADAMEMRTSEILAMENLKHDFLKVPHHGRYNDKSYELFDAVDATYAVVTAETCEDKTRNALVMCGTRVFVTDNDDVMVKCDGIELTVQQE